MNENVLIRKSFKESLKIKENLEKIELIKIQKELEKDGITLKIVQELTQYLNKEQKKNLIALYRTQIEDLENSIENYKTKILAIRKKINKENKK